MKSFWLQFFTWWHNQTLGTRFWTWRKGEKVGEDAAGNRYYIERRPKEGRQPRRWVVYNGLVEASRVPAEWHGWLHYTVDTPPGEDGYEPRAWERPHQPNLTGTPLAYRPKGSLLKGAERPPATGDYDPWRPE